jgi:hypothetical protein
MDLIKLGNRRVLAELDVRESVFDAVLFHAGKVRAAKPQGIAHDGASLTRGGCHRLSVVLLQVKAATRSHSIGQREEACILLHHGGPIDINQGPVVLPSENVAFFVLHAILSS